MIVCALSGPMEMMVMGVSSSLSRNAAQLEKELTKKKLAFAQRDEAERARTAEALAEEQGKTETKTDVAEQMTEAVTEQSSRRCGPDASKHCNRAGEKGAGEKSRRAG